MEIKVSQATILSAFYWKASNKQSWKFGITLLGNLVVTGGFSAQMGW